MGRLIVCDNVVDEKVNCIIKEKVVHTGLIIGQNTLQKDIVIRLCPTPSKDDLLLEISPLAEEKMGAKKKATKGLDLDEQWICQHAKQVTRALPGGFDVLGLYIAAPSDYASKHQLQLRQILYAVYKLLSRSQKLNNFVTERILLNICTVTSKCICRTYDIEDFKCSATPAEWKMSSASLKWHRVQCQLAVDLKFSIKDEEKGLSLQKQIETALQPFFKSINSAYPIINGARREMNELLDISTEDKKSKHKTPFTQQTFVVELYVPVESNNNISNPEVCDCVCMMTFKGIVHCRAYVHSRSTVKDAVDALRQDIIRSLTARCEIHCEDLLLIDEEHQDPLVVHELPRRVFARLPQEDISVCDYQFHGDTASDSLEAFRELFDLDITEQDVDTSCEISPSTRALILPEVMEDRLSELGDSPATNRHLLVPLAGAAIAAVAAGISYFMLLSSSQGN